MHSRIIRFQVFPFHCPNCSTIRQTEGLCRRPSDEGRAARERVTLDVVGGLIQRTCQASAYPPAPQRWPRPVGGHNKSSTSTKPPRLPEAVTPDLKSTAGGRGSCAPAGRSAGASRRTRRLIFTIDAIVHTQPGSQAHCGQNNCSNVQYRPACCLDSLANTPFIRTNRPNPRKGPLFLYIRYFAAATVLTAWYYDFNMGA